MSPVTPPKYPKWFDIALIFFVILFVTSLFLMLFAQIFAGHWYAVNMKDELPNALIFSTVMTSIVVVARYLAESRARTLVRYGFAIVALEVFLELPLKKYVAIVPTTGIRDWFFFFGMAEFAGMFLILLGLSIFMRSFHKNTP